MERAFGLYGQPDRRVEAVRAVLRGTRGVAPVNIRLPVTLSANGYMFRLGLCKVGKQNDSRGNSKASAKQLSHNKSCRFQLEYIDMQPNHTPSVANIVENRYT